MFSSVLLVCFEVKPLVHCSYINHLSNHFSTKSTIVKWNEMFFSLKCCIFWPAFGCCAFQTLVEISISYFLFLGCTFASLGTTVWEVGFDFLFGCSYPSAFWFMLGPDFKFFLCPSRSCYSYQTQRSELLYLQHFSWPRYRGGHSCSNLTTVLSRGTKPNNNVPNQSCSS